MHGTPRHKMDITSQPERTNAQQRFASLLLHIEMLETRPFGPELRTQVRDQKYFLHIYKVLVRAEGHGFLVQTFQLCLSEREYLVSFSKNEIVAETILIRTEDSAHHG